MAVRIREMEMPDSCYNCPFFDDSGDYPTCTVNNCARGYNFNARNNRMPNCPLEEDEDWVEYQSDGYTRTPINGNVLITFKDGHVGHGWWTDGIGWRNNTSKGVLKTVLAWRYFPAPYKKK